jgi:hypothetical protein
MSASIGKKSRAGAIPGSGWLSLILAGLPCIFGPRFGFAQGLPQSNQGLSIGPLELSASGYFRAPLRFSFRSRGDKTPQDEASYNIHSPWLVDDDYFRSGFLYTRLQESDWSEFYLKVGSNRLTAEVALMGSLYSDWARPLIANQWGIAQGFLTFPFQSDGPRLHFHLHVRAGSFWDRFGWLENYDTYLFGRTHQMGGQVRLEFGLPAAGITLWLLQGIGAHQEDIESNQGLTLLNYLQSGINIRKIAQVGFYFLDAQSHDQRALKELKDASMRVVGLDAGFSSRLGRLYLGGSVITTAQAQYLSPVIEVMHSLGGRGLETNYFGGDKSDGVGRLWSLGIQYTFSLRGLLGKKEHEHLAAVRDGDLLLKLFSLAAYAERFSFKWGSELFVQPLSFLYLAFRYDYVSPDVREKASSFQVLSPRIGITTHWMLAAQIFLQYSRYYYGPKVRLRPGQVPLESLPDDNALKLQAQISF